MPIKIALVERRRPCGILKLLRMAYVCMSCNTPPSLFKVGEYIEAFNEMTEQELPCGPIFQSTGLLKHIQKRHPGQEGNLEHVPEVLAHPDYVGRNPNEPNSVEFVKILQANVMVCVKLDMNDGYFFVASVFEITTAKLERRIHSKRLRKY